MADMTGSIFAEVERDLARLGHGIEHGIASHIPHHHYDDPQERPGGNTMENPITEAVDFVEDAVANVESFGSRMKPHIATLAAEAQRIYATAGAQDVLKALESAGLPETWIPMTVDFIGKLGTLAAGQLLTAPAVPAETLPAPSQPDPQPQTGIAV